jgi:DNA-binding response OmpR family regulator
MNGALDGDAAEPVPAARAAIGGKTILIAEDDERTARLVALYLEREGARTELAPDGRVAIDRTRRLRPDLVILDLMLPGIDGWEVCRRLREESDTPIVMLTARGAEDERVQGLALGADDYVVKPFSPKELVARVAAVLRRTTRSAGAAAGPLTCGPLRLDPDGRTAAMRGERLALTPAEFSLLHALMSRPGRVFSRQELVARLYPGGADVVEKVVDVHIGELRGKIERDRSAPEFILTVRGIGYRLAGGAGGSVPQGEDERS